jgi:type IV secretory pathway VirB4 component
MTNNSPKTAQNFIPIKEVRDGIAILKDGSLRGVIMASSLNFALKSAEEQAAIIFQFQNLLNSLDFSVQISVQSRRLDIRPYLGLLKERQKEQKDDLIRIQTAEYIQFIRGFTEKVNIMSKTFFLVIPYTPATVSLGGNKTDNKKNLQSKTFEENQTQLEQRINIVEQGISRCGIRSVRLGTEELVELYYKVFNPGDTDDSVRDNR